jgi:hypothetical protein
MAVGWTGGCAKEGKAGWYATVYRQPKRKYVVLCLLQAVDDVDEKYVVCVRMDDRQALVKYSVYDLDDVIDAELPAAPAMDISMFRDHGNEFLKKPDGAYCEYAPKFGLHTRKRTRTTLVEVQDLTGGETGESDATTETPLPTGKKPKKLKSSGKKGATPAMQYKCLTKLKNGKVCGEIFATKRGLSNHRSAKHKVKPAPKKDAAEKITATSGKKSKEVSSPQLKLTVSLEAYNAMTAKVGERGVKRKEIRQVKVWTDSRLDGRHYDTVKLYGGKPYCSEEELWTEFVCLGYNQAGQAGQHYVVEGMGVEDEWAVVMDGVVWEIQLGRVLARNCGLQEDHWQDSIEVSEDGGDFGGFEDDPTRSLNFGSSTGAKTWQSPQGGASQDKTKQSKDIGYQEIVETEKRIADIITESQKGAFTLLGKMFDMQAEQLKESKAAAIAAASAAANRDNPMFNIDTIAKMRDMLGGKTL